MRLFGIANGNSGNCKDWELYQVELALRSQFDVRLIRTRSKEHLEHVLRENADFLPDVVALFGGDGSIPGTFTPMERIWGYIPSLFFLAGIGTHSNDAASFNLSDTFVDKAKKRFQFGRTRAMRTADYLVDCVSQGKNPNTEPIDLLDANGTKCFNFGLGLASKVVWAYYGRKPSEFRRLQEELNQADEKDYHSIIERSVRETGDGLSDHSGLAGILAGAADTIFRAMFTNYFIERFDKDVKFDGLAPNFDYNGLMISAYERINLGTRLLGVYPIPHARSEPGTMQAAFCQIGIGKIAYHVFRSMLWKRRTPGLVYQAGKKLEVTSEDPVIYHVDAEFHAAREITLKPYQTMHAIVPKSL